MDILIVATKTCQHRPMIEKELNRANLPYTVMYFEDYPELIEKYHSKHSPLLIVDEKVISRSVPETVQILELKERYTDISNIRTPQQEENHMVPKMLEEGLVEVDTT